MRTLLGVSGVLALGFLLLWNGGRIGGQSDGAPKVGDATKAGAVQALAQTAAQPAAPAGDEAAVRAAIEKYALSMKTGDLKQILDYWTTDADFTDEDGQVHKGHEAIGKLFAANLKDLKSGKSGIKIESLRFLTPDVAAMEGAIEFTPENGIPEFNRFSAVLAKRDGAWRIASARDLPELEGKVGERGMKELQWLAGDWTADDHGTIVKLNVKPGLDGRFAFMKYDIKTPKEQMTVLQVLGFDPVEGTLRSWAFDSRGGFGDSLWTRENNVWTSLSSGVLPSGQIGSSINLVQVTGPNSFTWKSTQREVEGQPIPDAELKYTRVVENR
jgi:uncharacterized protein (TIGR02246 family)